MSKAPMKNVNCQLQKNIGHSTTAISEKLNTTDSTQENCKVAFLTAKDAKSAKGMLTRDIS